MKLYYELLRIRMLRMIMCLGLVLSSNLLLAEPMLQSSSNTIISCVSMNDVAFIGKQINELFQQEFCEETVDPKTFASIGQNVLQKIMTKSFLEVTPPQNWQQVTDEIIKNCLGNNDLCKKEIRKEFEACIQLRAPFILLQFGPWITENCSQLNKSIIQKWSNKKAILKKIINENKIRNNKDLP